MESTKENKIRFMAKIRKFTSGTLYISIPKEIVEAYKLKPEMHVWVEMEG